MTIISGEPDKARSILVQHHSDQPPARRFLRCAERLGTGLISPADCNDSRGIIQPTP
jgi:hypothetical protein